MHEDVSLPVAECETCASTVLTYADVEGDTLIHRCVHCDSTAADLSWREPFEIVQLGYRLDGVVDPHAKRGCRGGACGVQQRV